ncbi:malto-oligosyltrehalose synthase [Streptomyces sp. ODS28]|uniref:malto-oligosyltrehalose synthase n=1 Tax=Streptomyces sp. ODS28 TaxID=3136688 RepID=UPI0031E8E2DB
MTPDAPLPAAAPTATYRLQLQPGFPFAAAERAVPRLAALGVSHLHLSPVLTAAPGSTHGYDVTDHTRVREELGGEEGLRSLSRTARSHGMGLILDTVPNHMAVPEDLRANAPLWSVLREGPTSPYARWFDIEWEGGGDTEPGPRHEGPAPTDTTRVLLPILAGPLDEELDHMTAPALSDPALPDHDPSAPQPPPPPQADPPLSDPHATLLYRGRPLPLRENTQGLPLPALLDAQHYRLAWWRLARTELNYRRFFTISELIGVRVEDPEVFDATHATLLRLLREGVADGLRVDHPDGLAHPGPYLSRLRRETGGRWTVVEKILARDEELPGSWPVAGTTGYDALHRIDGAFLDPYGYGELTALYGQFTGADPEAGGAWEPTARAAARDFVRHELVAETERLTRTALRIAGAAGLRDHSAEAVRTALREVLVRLPVYRPYVDVPPKGNPEVSERDVALVEAAAEGAREACGGADEVRAVDLVRDAALGRELAPDAGAPARAAGDRRDFAARFGQVASALRAKSLEDTAFYRYVPLLSACEVGGEPGRPAVPPDDFHAYCAARQRDHPFAGTVLSTHDTKRSADVRAAIALLTECPERWSGFLADPWTDALTGLAPDRHTAWTAWQTVLGLGGGGEPGQLSGWLLKSVREAGLRTTWTERNAPYEDEAERFAAAVAEAEPGARGPLAALLDSLAPYVRANVLGMALLQLTMPGVPEVYQGSEGVYRALTDPDNRAPLGEGDVSEAVDACELSREKQELTRIALRLRSSHSEWFSDSGTYRPLYAEGEAAPHCLAFTRSERVVTAVTRLGLRLHAAGGWRDTRLPLPEGRWRDVLSGRPVGGAGGCAVAGLFADGPVALLVRDP